MVYIRPRYGAGSVDASLFDLEICKLKRHAICLSHTHTVVREGCGNCNGHWIVRVETGVPRSLVQSNSEIQLITYQGNRLSPILSLTTNCGKFFKRWEYQTTWPASWKICMQVMSTIRTGYGTTDWFQIGKGVHQGCILSPWLFNSYAECIMWNAGLEEAQAGIKIA